MFRLREPGSLALPNLLAVIGMSAPLSASFGSGVAGGKFHLTQLGLEQSGACPSVVLELAQKMPNQKRTDDVQDNIGQVVTEGGVMPELPLEPLHALFNRIELDPASGRKPGFPEPVRIVDQRIIGNIPKVVSNPVSLKRGSVDQKNRADEKQGFQ